MWRSLNIVHLCFCECVSVCVLFCLSTWTDICSHGLLKEWIGTHWVLMRWLLRLLRLLLLLLRLIVLHVGVGILRPTLILLPIHGHAEELRVEAGGRWRCVGRRRCLGSTMSAEHAGRVRLQTETLCAGVGRCSEECTLSRRIRVVAVVLHLWRRRRWALLRSIHSHVLLTVWRLADGARLRANGADLLRWRFHRGRHQRIRCGRDEHGAWIVLLRLIEGWLHSAAHTELRREALVHIGSGGRL